MFTAEAAYELADRLGVEMPITNEIYKLIKGQITGKEAVMNLMGRERKPED
jgi:glycerol-3-phosphate dehydrogenase (NAD(P)+)